MSAFSFLFYSSIGGTKHFIRSVPVQAHPTATSTSCPLPALAPAPAPVPAPSSSSHSSTESDFASASADEVVAVTSPEMMELETETETETLIEDCVRQSENDHLHNSTREHLTMSCGVCGTMVSLIPPLLPVPSILTALAPSCCVVLLTYELLSNSLFSNGLF
jgi:hypothetical protein